MRAIAAVLLCLALGGGLACGGGERAPTPSEPPRSADAYPREAVDEFLRSCEEGPGATRAGCRCVIDRIRERYSFAQFRRAAEAFSRGETGGIDFAAIARSCR